MILDGLKNIDTYLTFVHNSRCRIHESLNDTYKYIEARRDSQSKA